MLDDTAIKDLAVMLAKDRVSDGSLWKTPKDRFDCYYQDISDWASAYGEHPPQDETDL